MVMIIVFSFRFFDWFLVWFRQANFSFATPYGFIPSPAKFDIPLQIGKFNGYGIHIKLYPFVAGLPTSKDIGRD